MIQNQPALVQGIPQVGVTQGGGVGEVIGGDQFNIMDENTGGGAPSFVGGGCPAGGCTQVVESNPPTDNTYTVTSKDGTEETFVNGE